MEHSGINFSDLVQAMAQCDASRDERGALSAGCGPSPDGRKPPLRHHGGGRAESGYSKGITEAVRGHLDSLHLCYSFFKEDGVFSYYLRLADSFFCFVVVNIRIFDQGFIIHASSPISAPHKDKKRMREAAEMLCRMNFGLRAGAFDLDVSDGEFSFRRFVDCTDIIPSRKMIDMALSAVSFAFYAYGKAIAEVFLGVSPAKDAVRRAEEKPLDISDDD